MLKRIKDLLSRRGKKQPTGTSSPDSASAAESARTLAAESRPRVQVGPRVVHRPIPESDLDPDAVKIVNRLTRFDHSAYLVGGCVRDLLLDQRPKDFDIGTSATPRQIKRLFRNSRIIGRRFRLAHIYFQRGKIIEVATFRAQNIEENGNGPKGKKDLLIREDNLFGTPEEDALRRDFTVNALFYDVSRKTVLDHADGLGDLRRRLIRTIGDPEVRFQEDPIRILRAIKFAARLRFDIERKTLRALKQAREEIPKAAAPRILEEVNRFCRGGAARRSFELLRQHGLFEILFSELAAAYDRRQAAWNLLFAMLDHVDEKQRKGYEVPTGAILAVLLIGVMRDDFGWRDDGEVQAPKGLDVRATTDGYLRPLAQRLRVSRKDQEYCRQILLTLFRMVPPRRARRGTKRSILRRECLPDAVWILGTLAGALGGEFPAAFGYWVRAAREVQPPHPETKSSRPRGEPARARSGSGGAGKRRRPRHRGPAGDARAQAERAAKPRRQERAEPLPTKWDDDYFFAALPSAPSSSDEDAQGDRYGAAAVAAGRDGSEQAPKAEGEASPKVRTKRRRRPRKRRRPPAGDAGSGDAGGESGSAG